MNHLTHPFLALCLTLTVGLTLSVGCCGPMWHPGSGIGCGPTCDDGCGACDGCGELYVDPWINDPADCCDPCDSCGNFNGQSCGKCRPVFAGVKSLWGYRCEDNCGGCDSAVGYGDDCGCDGGHGPGETYPREVYPGEVYEDVPGAIDQGYELGPGETLVEPQLSTRARSMNRDSRNLGGRAPSRIVSQPRRVPRPGDAREIFHARRVNDSRSLAY